MGNRFAEYLQTSGLYEPITIDEDNYQDFFELIEGDIKISEYCPECKEKRVFTMKTMIASTVGVDGEIHSCFLGESLRREDNHKHVVSMPGSYHIKEPWRWDSKTIEWATRVMHFSFVCAMDENHHLDYVLQSKGNTLVKIGQYPSVADLSFPMLDEVETVIDKESLAELRRAIGLFSHGIGVGSYVYLRRIFERIIVEAKKEADSKSEVLSGFDTLAMSDKIKALKDYLPDMITSNAVIYNIVSKGIHELSEDECKQYFPVMKESIFLILKKWAQRKKEIEAERSLTKAINDINSEIAQKD